MATNVILIITGFAILYFRKKLAGYAVKINIRYKMFISGEVFEKRIITAAMFFIILGLSKIILSA